MNIVINISNEINKIKNKLKIVTYLITDINKENEKNKEEIQNIVNNLTKINKTEISKNINCNTIHYGIICKNCSISPIIGYRYKCIECPDYNLCQNCEEQNSINEFHSHEFIKFRYLEIKNKINSINNGLNNINVNLKEDYSYQCKNNSQLIVYTYEGINELKIDLTLLNNGNKPWSLDTKLIFDNNFKIKGEDIKLKPQKPGEKNTYEIILKNFNKFISGEYYTFLKFKVDGQNYGENLMIKIYINYFIFFSLKKQKTIKIV